ncbi:MAG: 4-(cytidine 5'-diphospho)-2-C-methyl-D-erythritol kinase [Lysobacterales bacterium]
MAAEVLSVWPAPAKINLFLHVLGRRADRYHRIQTVFQLVDLCDRVLIQPSDDGRIERYGELASVRADQDLSLTAARLLQQASGSRKGARIGLDKRIPIGAGLGGGSSDAATVLVGLNRIWGLGLDTVTLAALGLQLGADVPLFVHGRSAWADGIGEQLLPIALPEAWYVVIFPGVAVSTPEVFNDPALTRDTPPTTIPRFLSGEATRNDLQAPAVARCPEIGAALAWLDRFAPARMSGSGSSVFARVAMREQGDAVVRRCPPAWQSFVVRGLSASPLVQADAAWLG